MKEEVRVWVELNIQTIILAFKEDLKIHFLLMANWLLTILIKLLNLIAYFWMIFPIEKLEYNMEMAGFMKAL